ncbi:MAG: hypothetical protein ABJG47_12990 [Ekhidna sp.]
MSESIPFSVPVEGVEVKKFSQNSHNYLHFTFNGKFTHELSSDAIDEWKSQCKMNPSEKFVHIWDCQNMSGFDKQAKDLWMEQMNSLYDQTERIVLVSDNIIIRGAARLMSRFTKHTLCAYRTLVEMSAAEL